MNSLIGGLVIAITKLDKMSSVALVLSVVMVVAAPALAQILLCGLYFVYMLKKQRRTLKSI